jgi:hypothetical protein
MKKRRLVHQGAWTHDKTRLFQMARDCERAWERIEARRQQIAQSNFEKKVQRAQAPDKARGATA